MSRHEQPRGDDNVRHRRQRREGAVSGTRKIEAIPLVHKKEERASSTPFAAARRRRQPIRWTPLVFMVLSFASLIVYLFVSAPPPLPERAVEDSGAMLSVAQLIQVCADENAAVRAMYTKEIVGFGKQVGLSFSEQWKQADENSGPLPALFLRETAAHLERSSVPLGLFLGSSNPINKANLFRGIQREAFRRIKETREPEFFYDESTERHTAMFPDVAVAKPCVSCHNEHEDSTKRDWKLGDVMGATTWSYPKESVPLREAMRVVAALRQSYLEAYAQYVRKAQEFENAPAVGERWPRDGYYLPRVDRFAARAAKRSSAQTLNSLISAALE